MRYSQEDGVNTSLSRLVLYPRSVFECALLCVSIILPAAQSCDAWDAYKKDDVCKPSIPAGLKRPPPSKTISLITRFGPKSTIIIRWVTSNFCAP